MSARQQAIAMTAWYAFFIGVQWLAVAFSVRVLVFAVTILSTLFVMVSLFATSIPKEQRITGWPRLLALVVNAVFWAWAISMSRAVGVVAGAFTTLCLVFTVRELWLKAAAEKRAEESFRLYIGR